MLRNVFQVRCTNSTTGMYRVCEFKPKMQDRNRARGIEFTLDGSEVTNEKVDRPVYPE